MRKNNLDLLLILLIVGLNILTVLIPAIPTFMKLALALPLIFGIPGYLLICVFFHKSILNFSHQLTLSLTLSLGTVILSGFLLNRLPNGLHTTNWSIFFVGLSTLLLLYTFFLRRSTQKQVQPPIHFRMAPLSVTCLLLALIASIGSIVYSANSVSQQPHPAYTQLWIVPTQKDSDQWQVNVGIQNEENTTLQYQLVMSINGKKVKTWSSLSLSSQQTWKQIVPLITQRKEKTSVELQLYRSGQTENAYREVHITLNNN